MSAVPPADTEPVPRGSAPGFTPARRFHHSLLDFLRDLPRGQQRFWVLVVVVGLVSGLGSVVLVEVLRFAQHLAWKGTSEHFEAGVVAASGWRRVGVLLLGGALVTLLSLLVGQPLRGHGTAGIIESIWAKSGRLALPRALLRGGVSILAVAFGAPLGREGALLSTGAASGSALARALRTPADQARLLVACGAAAGMAGAYNVPIGAALFGLEVLLGSFALELFGPIVVACVVATLVSRVLVADHPSYLIPHYVLSSPRELLLAPVVGAVLGAGSALYVWVVNGVAGVLEQRAPRALAPWLPIPAMLLTGVAALHFPQLLGNGYDSVNAALLGRLPLLLLLTLPVLKMLFTALCAGAGVPGGLFTPSLFYGALLGGAFGYLAAHVLPGSAPVGAYALLGMGAVLAGTTHATVSAVLLIFEMTGDYGLILPLMLAAVASAIVARALEGESLYTSALKRRNVPLPGGVEPGWLRGEGVRALLGPVQAPVDPATPFDELVVRLLELPAGHDLYVADGQRRLLGVVVLEQLKGHLPDHSLLGMTVAADVMDRDVPAITPELSLSEVAARFAETSLERLPVLDGQRRLLGTISKTEVLRRARF